MLLKAQSSHCLPSVLLPAAFRTVQCALFASLCELLLHVESKPAHCAAGSDVLIQLQPPDPRGRSSAPKTYYSSLHRKMLFLGPAQVCDCLLDQENNDHA